MFTFKKSSHALWRILSNISCFWKPKEDEVTLLPLRKVGHIPLSYRQAGSPQSGVGRGSQQHGKHSSTNGEM